MKTTTQHQLYYYTVSGKKRPPLNMSQGSVATHLR